MNKRDSDILKYLKSKPYSSQRILAESCGCSLGAVNQSIKKLTEEGFLSETGGLTRKTMELFSRHAPKNAVILAAGFGMRMVPINMEAPKGLLEVQGEPLIERIITQLHQAGIQEICIVVGFMKECYEYLMDKYGVDLVVNPEYAGKNNLHSLKYALNQLSNTYIVPCDIWCRNNPFSNCELDSWYMVRRDCRQPERAEEKDLLGICYLTEPHTSQVVETIREMCRDSRFDGAFWESALFRKKRMQINLRPAAAEDVVEIDTYEQLRELDRHSSQLRTDAITTIARTMGVKTDEITNITVLKKGMTNRSFLFDCRDSKYIMRIPGEGTEKLINRRQEAAVYDVIRSTGICDDICYINPENGYKITRYLDNARVCDPENEKDLECCMAALRRFHGMELQVKHPMDIFGMIDFYESLWNGNPSAYRDYTRTKERVFSLKEYIDAHQAPFVLTHIDAVPDNFLFVRDEEGNTEIRLIDWEYAGMQDPHVDIAMFCIYSLYSRAKADRLIDLYFQGECSRENRIKIYCYIACCGLLWSNWCEYKAQLGVEFGEYSLRQYRYAKDYYRIVQEELAKLEEESECIR